MQSCLFVCKKNKKQVFLDDSTTINYIIDIVKSQYFLVNFATGLAPLAARPAKRLSIVCFAIKMALPKCRKAKHFAPAKWLFSRKVRFSLRSVTANAKFMRLLISSLQGITNALLNG